MPVGDKEGNEQGPHIHPILQLFTSFWAPLDAGLLDRRAAASSWLKSISECLVLIIRRGIHAKNVTAAHANEDARALLAAQFSRLWSELVVKRLRVDEVEAAGIIARAAERLGKVADGMLMLTVLLSIGPLIRITDLFDASFNAFCSAILDSVYTSHNTLDMAPTFFHLFASTFTPETHAAQKTRSVVEIYIGRVIETLETALGSSDQTLIANTAKHPLAGLVKLMDTFGPSLFDDRSLTSRIDVIFIAHPIALLQVSTQGVLAYLRHRTRSSDQSQGEIQTQAFWTELLGALASSPTNVALSLLHPLVGASFPVHLRGVNAAMDELVERLVSNAIVADTQGNEEMAVARVLGTPGIAFQSSGLVLCLNFFSALYFTWLFDYDHLHAFE